MPGNVNSVSPGGVPPPTGPKSSESEPVSRTESTDETPSTTLADSEGEQITTSQEPPPLLVRGQSSPKHESTSDDWSRATPRRSEIDTPRSIFAIRQSNYSEESSPLGNSLEDMLFQTESERPVDDLEESRSTTSDTSETPVSTPSGESSVSEGKRTGRKGAVLKTIKKNKGSIDQVKSTLSKTPRSAKSEKKKILEKVNSVIKKLETIQTKVIGRQGSYDSKQNPSLTLIRGSDNLDLLILANLKPEINKLQIEANKLTKKRGTGIGVTAPSSALIKPNPKKTDLQEYNGILKTIKTKLEEIKIQMNEPGTNNTLINYIDLRNCTTLLLEKCSTFVREFSCLEQIEESLTLLNELDIVLESKYFNGMNSKDEFIDTFQERVGISPNEYPITGDTEKRKNTEHLQTFEQYETLESHNREAESMLSEFHREMNVANDIINTPTRYNKEQISEAIEIIKTAEQKLMEWNSRRSSDLSSLLLNSCSKELGKLVATGENARDLAIKLITEFNHEAISINGKVILLGDRLQQTRIRLAIASATHYPSKTIKPKKMKKGLAVLKSKLKTDEELVRSVLKSEVKKTPQNFIEIMDSAIKNS
jgi:hypothetical protein